MAKLTGMFGEASGETLFDLPRCDDLEQMPEAARVVILGAATATPYASVGAYCAGAPRAIREASAAYGTTLPHVNFDLGAPTLPDGVLAVDAGDLPIGEEAAANRACIRAAVERVRTAGAVPLLIGGDDSVPLPMIAAFEGQGPVWILQIDAHIDWRDSVEGERFGLSSTMRRASEMAHVAGIVQVGQRGIGSARAADMAEAIAAGVTFVPAREVCGGDGIARAVTAIPAGARVIICFDCDGLDPAIMPAVIAPTAGGLGYWQAMELIAGVAERAEIVAFDLVELMPERDIDGRGALLAAQLLATVMGIVARQGR
ncbi:agmatinase [Haematobacter missouriensis]|uniref:Arginase n=1 Tax=Haematobacter missouriensis TaxID=366616 RepID=A0A212AMY7_9RHOB|nr:arginase family protein [Haematobacter missouriensis]KFI26539.1 agmatinase [Haematobacter missouriensis]OWJ72896.1 arginase [Haematobacter missouriensis]OWJ82880.1 arginase [Haematobacter missouriensis]